MVESASTAKLALMVGKEVSEAVKQHIKQRPGRDKKKALKKFFDLMLELETEKKKPKRDHDKILHLKSIRDLFLGTVMKGVESSVKD